MAVPAARPVPPNQTVYVHNLDERTNIEDLTTQLRVLFSQYGNVLDVVAKSSLKRRGQAFVVFDNVDSATRAIDEIQGFPLFDKPMVLEYARSQSDKVVELSGSADDLEAHKRHRLAEKERKQALELQQSQLKKAGAPSAAEAAAPASKPIKSKLKSTAGAAAVIPDEYLPPNKTLFVQNIPEDYDVEGLQTLFSRFEGFREVRLVPGRKGIAFVEYEAEAGAISAKERMANMPLGDTQQTIKVTYQRQ